jgi:hypothetical protein
MWHLFELTAYFKVPIGDALHFLALWAFLRQNMCQLSHRHNYMILNGKILNAQTFSSVGLIFEHIAVITCLKIKHSLIGKRRSLARFWHHLASGSQWG